MAHVTAQGVFNDLQKNVVTTFERRQRIVCKGGRRYSQDMINMTANAGLGLAALALAGDKINDSDQAQTEKCGAVLRYVLESLPHGLSTYGVEGSLPEGMAYSVTLCVAVFTIPILLTPNSVNQRLPSGPDVISLG